MRGMGIPRERTSVWGGERRATESGGLRRVYPKLVPGPPTSYFAGRPRSRLVKEFFEHCVPAIRSCKAGTKTMDGPKKPGNLQILIHYYLPPISAQSDRARTTPGAPS